MRKCERGVSDLSDKCLDLQKISQKSGLEIVRFDLFDRKMATVDDGRFSGAKEILTAGHFTKIEISGVVDDAAHIGIFVVDSYLQVNPFFYFSKVV